MDQTKTLAGELAFRVLAGTPATLLDEQYWQKKFHCRFLQQISRVCVRQYSRRGPRLRCKSVAQLVRAGVSRSLPEILGFAVLLFDFACSIQAAKAQKCRLANMSEVLAGQRNCLTRLRSYRATVVSYGKNTAICRVYYEKCAASFP